MLRRCLAATLLLATATGCTTVAPATRRVDPDTLPNCTRACSAMGMKVGAVVIVDEIGGCVCEPVAPAAPRADACGSAGSEAVAGGGTIGGGVVMIMAARQRRQHQQQAHR